MGATKVSVGRMKRAIRRAGGDAFKIRWAAAAYVVGIVDYLSAELLELAAMSLTKMRQPGTAPGWPTWWRRHPAPRRRKHNGTSITPRCIADAIWTDADLWQWLGEASVASGGAPERINAGLFPGRSRWWSRRYRRRKPKAKKVKPTTKKAKK